MIRYATTSDIGRIVEMAEREHARSLWADHPFDAAYTQDLARSLVEMFGATVLMSERGYLAGMVQPMGFSRALMAIEYAFYCEDGQGLALLRAFEQWAHRMGARYVVAHDYAVDDDRLANVLVRRYHYRRLGTALSKELH